MEIFAINLYHRSHFLAAPLFHNFNLYTGHFEQGHTFLQLDNFWVDDAIIIHSPLCLSMMIVSSLG